MEQNAKGAKPRVLMAAPHIDATSSRGGAIHQTELLEAMRAKNNILAVFQNGREGDLSIGRMPQPILTAVTFLKILCCAKKFDLIHDRGYLLGGAGVLAGKMRKVPTVLQIDDHWIDGDKASGHWAWKSPAYERFARFWIRNFVPRADAIAAVSASLKDVAVKEWHARPEKVFVVGNGVNLDKFNPHAKAIRNELGISKGAKLLSFAGEMAPWHGIIETVKAAEIVLEKRDDCYFVFAGGAKTHERYVETVKAYVNSRGLGSNILFTGRMPYEKVPSFLASADVLLAPYVQPRHSNFGFSPLKLFEYMAMKKPIITSDLPWIREILSEKEASLLKDPRDGAEYSKKILTLLSAKRYADGIAKNARRLAVERHSWDAVAANMQAIYEDVLGRH